MKTSIPQQRPSVAELFLPKLLTVLREGYDARALRADALAGLTVAIVALPLSMAIAIASGVGPERGLYTAIVGGFLVSALGGSRFQVGGPAGAFIVLVAACVAQIGVGGLILATILSGAMLMVAGALRLGSYIRFIPYPVTVGFTAGIGVIIFASQLTGLFGLTLAGPEPGPLIDKLGAIWTARGSVTWAAVAVAAGTIAIIEALKRWRPRWPSLLIGVAAATLATALLGLPVETIGSRFGALPRLPPLPGLPAVDAALVAAALPWAAQFTLLGAIESLLSAVVADGMSGRHHRANAELVAQGVANIGAGLFGGFCVTGTIARTATNVRAGARGPVAGMLHSVFLLGFLLLAAPLASGIPLAALAGVLAIVAWGMIEREAMVALARASRGEAAVLAVTFLLVVLRDLTEGIVIGFAMGSLLFIGRMSRAVEVRAGHPLMPDDRPDTRGPIGDGLPDDAGVMVWHLRGAVFFGAAGTLASALDRIAERPRALVLDLSETPFVDTSGARMLAVLADRMVHQGCRVWISGATPEVRRMLLLAGMRPPAIRYKARITDAVAAARAAPPAT